MSESAAGEKVRATRVVSSVERKTMEKKSRGASGDEGDGEDGRECCVTEGSSDGSSCCTLGQKQKLREQLREQLRDSCSEQQQKQPQQQQREELRCS